MATIEDFFLERYEQLERERDGLRTRVADLERQMQMEHVEDRERREAEREKTDEA